MRKLTSFLLAAVITVAGFTSCLEGSNTTTEYNVGILGYSKNFTTPVMKTLVGDFYGPELNSLISSNHMEIGEGWFFQLTYDRDLPENTLEMVELNGYYTASISPMVKAESFYVMPILTDTSEVMAAELPVSDILAATGPFGFAEGYLFMTHVVNHEKDTKLNWDMSYASNDFVTEENGKRYYNLYIRATQSGGDGKQSSADQAYLNMYQLSDFFDRAALHEKNAAGSANVSFTVKFNYVAEITESGIVWGSAAEDLPISLFIPE
jgi:hypothetical protein